MSQEGTKLTRNKRMLAIVVVLASFAAVVFTLWIYDTLSKLDTKPDAPAQVSTVQVEAPVVAAAKEQPATEPEVVETPAVAQPTQTARVAVQEAPQPASKWEAPMTEAGISAADQPIVESLVFKDYEWSLHTCACSRLVYGTMFNPTSRFQILNHYVVAHYTNWTNAAAQAAQGAW